MCLDHILSQYLLDKPVLHLILELLMIITHLKEMKHLLLQLEYPHYLTES